MSLLFKFTVEVIDVFNNFAVAVFIVVVNDDDENEKDDDDNEDDDDNNDDDVDNEDNDVDDDHNGDNDDGDEDDTMAVARLCCSVVTLITSSEFLAYDGIRDGIS